MPRIYSSAGQLAGWLAGWMAGWLLALRLIYPHRGQGEGQGFLTASPAGASNLLLDWLAGSLAAWRLVYTHRCQARVSGEGKKREEGGVRVNLAPPTYIYV